ncbi:MAG: DUF3592 domain-containing protein [Clostridia bacterium]|nr:DUF3592 domain-containing protein [Clostridia bacterium]
MGISVHRSQETAKISRYIITTGTIVDYKVTTMNKGEVHKVYGYAEIAEFEVDGVTYTATNSISSTYGANDIGDSIKIAYNPLNPHDCIFVASSNDVFIIFAALLGSIITCLGIAVLICYCIRYNAWKKSNA